MKKQNRNRDQHKRAQKEAKRKTALAEKTRQSPSSLSLINRARAAASTYGVSYCMITEGIFDTGIGHVVLGRTKSPSTVATAVFLVDVHCLGVKNGFYAELPHEKLTEMIKGMAGTESRFIDIDPECARKIVVGAVEYARDLGFSPHSDYPPAEALFGDIDAGACNAEYDFGKEGKPFFFAGPHDTPSKIKKVIRTLADKVGEGNFDYIAMVDGL